LIRITNLSAQVVRVDSPPSEDDTPLVLPEKISLESVRRVARLATVRDLVRQKFLSA